MQSPFKSFKNNLDVSPYDWELNSPRQSEPDHVRACECGKSCQSCPTLCDPMDYSLPGSSVHEIFQAGLLE